MMEDWRKGGGEQVFDVHNVHNEARVEDRPRGRKRVAIFARLQYGHVMNGCFRGNHDVCIAL